MKSRFIHRIEEISGLTFSNYQEYGGVIVDSSGNRYYLKRGKRGLNYICEANGVAEIKSKKIIETPEVVAVDKEFILTRYIMGVDRHEDFFEDFGKKLALLHQCHSESFGFYENNFIGANPQINIPSQEEEAKSWPAFYLNKRLIPQFNMAKKRGYINDAMDKNFSILSEKIYEIIGDSQEKPSLLHGDLWSGNFLVNSSGYVTVIDPAVYYGHREAEIAMTRLFGLFPDTFYDSYNKLFPLKPGWVQRQPLYKLYHLLNHLNIFGNSYLYEVKSILEFYK